MEIYSKERKKGKELTARDRPQEEGRHFPGQRIQAASLISKGPPTRLQG